MTPPFYHWQRFPPRAGKGVIMLAFHDVLGHRIRAVLTDTEVRLEQYGTGILLASEARQPNEIPDDYSPGILQARAMLPEAQRKLTVVA